MGEGRFPACPTITLQRLGMDQDQSEAFKKTFNKNLPNQARFH
jgi:hypothetical protein